MQFVTSTSDCQTRIPRLSSQACAGNCERRCTVLWMLLNVGENTMLGFWRQEDFHEARLLRATSSTKACKHTLWSIFFIVGRREERKNALSLLRSAYDLSIVVTLGPWVVTVKDSEVLGQNTDIATMGNRVRARQAARFSRLQGFGIDRC